MDLFLEAEGGFKDWGTMGSLVQALGIAQMRCITGFQESLNFADLWVSTRRAVH